MLTKEALNSAKFEFILNDEFCKLDQFPSILFSDSYSSSLFAFKRVWWGAESSLPSCQFAILLHIMVKLYASGQDPFSIIKIKCKNDSELYSVEDLENYFVNNKRFLKFVAKRTKSGVSNELSKSLDLGEALKVFRLGIIQLLDNLAATTDLSKIKNQIDTDIWRSFYKDHTPDAKVVFGHYADTKLFDLFSTINSINSYYILEIDNKFAKYSECRDISFNNEITNNDLDNRYDSYKDLTEHSFKYLELFSKMLNNNVMNFVSLVFYIYFNLLLGFSGLHSGNKDKNRLTIDFNSSRGMAILAQGGGDGNYHTRNTGCNVNRISGFLPILATFLSGYDVSNYTAITNLDFLSTTIKSVLSSNNKDTKIDRIVKNMSLDTRLDANISSYKNIYATLGSLREFLYINLFKEAEIDKIVTTLGSEPLNKYFPSLIKLITKGDIKSIKDQVFKNKMMSSMSNIVTAYSVMDPRLDSEAPGKIVAVLINNLFSPQVYGSTSDKGFLRYFFMPISHIKSSNFKNIMCSPNILREELFKKTELNDGYTSEGEDLCVSPYDMKLLECSAFLGVPPGPRDFLGLTTQPISQITLIGICLFFITAGISETCYEDILHRHESLRSIEFGVRVHDTEK